MELVAIIQYVTNVYTLLALVAILAYKAFRDYLNHKKK